MGWLAIGALLAALSVLAGAFGAHGLEGRIDERSLELWETAARYLMYSSVGLMLAGLSARMLNRSLGAAGWCLLGGGLIFSGTVFALALGAPGWLGAITPVGGLLLIAGFVLLGAFAWAGRRA